MSAIGAQQNIVGSSLLRLRVDAGGIGGVARHTANGGIDRLHAMRHEDLLADKDGRLAMNSTSMSGSGFVRQRELGAFEGAPLFGDVAARASVSAMNEILARNLSKVLKEKSPVHGSDPRATSRRSEPSRRGLHAEVAAAIWPDTSRDGLRPDARALAVPLGGGPPPLTSCPQKTVKRE